MSRKVFVPLSTPPIMMDGVGLVKVMFEILQLLYIYSGDILELEMFKRTHDKLLFPSPICACFPADTLLQYTVLDIRRWLKLDFNFSQRRGHFVMLVFLSFDTSYESAPYFLEERREGQRG